MGLKLRLVTAAALFDDFLGRMNSISEQTGATDFEDIIPVLQQEIPGLVVYEVEDDTDDNDTDGEEKYIDEDDDEPSVEDFHDVEGNILVLESLCKRLSR